MRTIWNANVEEDDNLVIENARKVEGLLKSILIGGTEGGRGLN